MNFQAFYPYDLTETLYLYLASRMPLMPNRIFALLKQKKVKYNSNTCVYNVNDEQLENYFKQVDEQIQNENTTDLETFQSPYKALAKQLRALYPNGLKYGTVKYWRGNTFEICKKLETLSTIMPLNTEECIKATKEYINSFDGDFQYMRTLPYFILKVTIVDGQYEYTSDLLTMIEYIRDPDNNEIPIHTDWIADLK